MLGVESYNSAMSTTIPMLEGTALATAAEVQALRQELADLRRHLEETQRAALPGSWREAVVPLQAGYASLTEEERALYAEATQQAREALPGSGPSA